MRHDKLKQHHLLKSTERLTLSSRGYFTSQTMPPISVTKSTGRDYSESVFFHENLIAFLNALNYLGIDLSCGDITNDNWLNVGDVVMMIDYLFRGGTPPDGYRADVNCDSVVNMADALEIINLVFRNGPGLNCCH